MVLVIHAVVVCTLWLLSALNDGRWLIELTRCVISLQELSSCLVVNQKRRQRSIWMLSISTLHKESSRGDYRSATAEPCRRPWSKLGRAKLRTSLQLRRNSSGDRWCDFILIVACHAVAFQFYVRTRLRTVQGTICCVAVKIGRICLQPRGVTRWWCSLLPIYFGQLF